MKTRVTELLGIRYPIIQGGISLGKNDKKWGQKGAHTCDVMFDNERVPAANLIGDQEGQGVKTGTKVLEKGRIHLAAECMVIDAARKRDEGRNMVREARG
jgi:alkylation response protein AidB-like acyl-CoA dehydrogenase